MTTLYRATTSGYDGQWSCWSTDRETATAYTEDGVGHGGETIVERDVDLSSCLDVYCGQTGVDFRALADALGYENADETAREWRDAGYLYPWEESKAVRTRLAESGREWLRYGDDYPELAVTLMRIKI